LSDFISVNAVHVRTLGQIAVMFAALTLITLEKWEVRFGVRIVREYTGFDQILFALNRAVLAQQWRGEAIAHTVV
jgi:hypothetical protein